MGLGFMEKPSGGQGEDEPSQFEYEEMRKQHESSAMGSSGESRWTAPTSDFLAEYDEQGKSKDGDIGEEKREIIETEDELKVIKEIKTRLIALLSKVDVFEQKAAAILRKDHAIAAPAFLGGEWEDICEEVRLETKKMKMEIIANLRAGKRAIKLKDEIMQAEAKANKDFRALAQGLGLIVEEDLPEIK